MKVGARTDVGRVRQVNEDGYLVLDGLLAVADGMGGHRAGEVASRLALETIRQVAAGSNHRDELVAAIRQANRVIRRAAAEHAGRAGMGTTLTAARVVGGTCYVGHVGDSRAYLVRGAEMRPLTEDHSVVAELVRRGQITEAESVGHPHRHLLTRALGTGPEVEVDVAEVRLATGDRLVLCTDGLTGIVEGEEIHCAVLDQPDPQAAADYLVGLANERGGWDNVTVVIGVYEAMEGAPEGGEP